MKGFIVCLLVLEIASCQSQLEKHRCVGDVEIAFSTDKTDFEGAKISCQSFGGKLVKIGNAKMQAEIENAIPIEDGVNVHHNTHYIGAYDDNGDNVYKWLVDDAKVPKNPKVKWLGPSGYQNWKSNQPNIKEEKCVALGVHGVHTWSDVTCELVKGKGLGRYICQRDVISISNSGSSAVCKSPVSRVGVRWEQNSATVESSDKGRVYQTMAWNYATLHYAKADISEAGTYTCTTTNPSCPATKTYAVTVDGTPTIELINNNKCNSSLFVTWKANKAAVGFKHRFTVPSTEITKDETPTDIGPLTTEITGLDFKTDYEVKIKVCTTTFTAKRAGTTDGITDPVTLAKLQYTDSCTTTWESTDSSAVYTIERKCRVDKFRAGGEGQQSTNGTTKNRTHTFQPGPNRNCSATIWAKGCGKISTLVEATGSCITPPKEPVKIEPPMLEGKDTDKIIKIPKPSEDNGLISCVFIVLCYDKCTETQLTVQDLENAGNTDITNNTIALAINMSSVSENQITRKLFQKEATSCNLNNTEPASKRSGKVIKGKNFVDNGTNKDVWAYIVTSTPSGKKILLKSSKPVIVLKYIPAQGSQSNSSTGPIIGAVVGVIVLLVLATVAVYFIWKKRQQQAEQPKPQTDNVPPEAPPEVPRAETRFGGSVRPPRRLENPVNPIQGEVGGGYMNFVAPEESGTGIKVRDLESKFADMKNKGTFKEQYDDIVKKAGQLNKTTNAAKNEAVMKKNRYKNILPYDDCRVPLVGSPAGYINASFVNGFRHPNRYIATQGPLKSTIADFWLMTMEQNSQIIVMLTREYDAGKKKCEKYWPDFGKTLTFNQISVTCTQDTSYNSYIERIFTVKDKTTGKILTTYQYQFMKWPDHGVPQTTSNLMRMQRVVTKKLNELGSQAPIIVHCSAGAGRTGAFIAYDILLKESQATGKVDVYGCVMEMRKRRIQMVQNCDQYILVYKLLVEENIFDECDASADQIKRKVQEILTTRAGAAQMEKEFGLLDRTEPMKNQKLVGIERKNQQYNRGRLAIPYDYSLVSITMKPGDSAVPYMNASFVETYDNDTRLIAAQSPFEKTVEIFWRAALDNRVTTIAMLCDLMEGTKEQSAQYWPSKNGDTSSWGDITVKSIDEEDIENITKRKLQLSRGPEVKYVTQFHYTGWKENSCPDDAREILGLVSRVQKHSRSAGKGGAILVHCNDGIGRTGTFCAIVNLIDRLKWENRIDVFRTVKDLRDGRPYMVQNLDQYQFCYQAIVGYLKSFELYANF